MRYSPDHLHFRSTDADAAAHFYVEMFGATETGRAVQPKGNLRVMLDLGGLPIFLEGVPEGTGAPPAPPFLGLEHLGLRVDDLEAAAAALKAKGVRFTLEPTEIRPGVRIAFVQAPDGVQVELLQRG
ncbi:VOC family protein [Roseococcus sp. DSY-14]|uniref:VOC family protein n=1 Tax=Roseococcus sp. DSY-14 TaxID=3369650 RepID=UPI00387AC3CB